MEHQPQVALVLPQLTTITEMLERALSGAATAEWYTIEQAYKAKYGDPNNGPSLVTLKKNLALQPRGGIPDGWQQSRKVWRRETITRWILVDDTTLADYLAEVAPGTRVPQFIQDSLQKRTRPATPVKRERSA